MDSALVQFMLFLLYLRILVFKSLFTVEVWKAKEREYMATQQTNPPDSLLAGLKIVYAAAGAGPLAAAQMADFGAEVIWLEDASHPDPIRSTPYAAELDRRNQRSVCVDLRSAQGKSILLRLLAETAVFIVDCGPTDIGRRLTDEELWEVNPALVIVRVSGFGLTGDPQYIDRPVTDGTLQAFGCMMYQNGFPDRLPAPAAPALGERLASYFISAVALAAVHKAQESGQGDSIDLASYESILRCQLRALDYMNSNILFSRDGNRSGKIAGYGVYECKDGLPVYLLILGGGVVRKALPLLGLEYGSTLFPEGCNQIPIHSEAGRICDKALQDFCDQHTAAEVSEIFNENGIPCSLVNNFSIAIQEPHYLARENWTEWQSPVLGNVRGPNVIPRLSNHPGYIWRGCPKRGQDNETVLATAGFSSVEIAALYTAGVLYQE